MKKILSFLFFFNFSLYAQEVIVPSTQTTPDSKKLILIQAIQKTYNQAQNRNDHTFEKANGTQASVFLPQYIIEYKKILDAASSDKYLNNKGNLEYLRSYGLSLVTSYGKTNFFNLIVSNSISLLKDKKIIIITTPSYVTGENIYKNLIAGKEKENVIGNFKLTESEAVFIHADSKYQVIDFLKNAGNSKKPKVLVMLNKGFETAYHNNPGFKKYLKENLEYMVIDEAHISAGVRKDAVNYLKAIHDLTPSFLSLTGTNDVDIQIQQGKVITVSAYGRLLGMGLENTQNVRLASEVSIQDAYKAAYPNIVPELHVLNLVIRSFGEGRLNQVNLDRSLESLKNLKPSGTLNNSDKAFMLRLYALAGFIESGEKEYNGKKINVREDGRALINVPSTIHGKFAESFLNNLFGKNFSKFLKSGDGDVDSVLKSLERNEENGLKAVIYPSFLDVGANIESLLYVFLLKPVHKVHTYLQILGRLLRNFKDKEAAFLFDLIFAGKFSDLSRYNSVNISRLYLKEPSFSFSITRGEGFARSAYDSEGVSQTRVDFEGFDFGRNNVALITNVQDAMTVTREIENSYAGSIPKEIPQNAYSEEKIKEFIKTTFGINDQRYIDWIKDELKNAYRQEKKNFLLRYKAHEKIKYHLLKINNEPENPFLGLVLDNEGNYEAFVHRDYLEKFTVEFLYNFYKQYKNNQFADIFKVYKKVNFTGALSSGYQDIHEVKEDGFLDKSLKEMVLSLQKDVVSALLQKRNVFIGGREFVIGREGAFQVAIDLSSSSGNTKIGIKKENFPEVLEIIKKLPRYEYLRLKKISEKAGELERYSVKLSKMPGGKELYRDLKDKVLEKLNKKQGEKYIIVGGEKIFFQGDNPDFVFIYTDKNLIDIAFTKEGAEKIRNRQNNAMIPHDEKERYLKFNSKTLKNYIEENYFIHHKRVPFSKEFEINHAIHRYFIDDFFKYIQGNLGPSHAYGKHSLNFKGIEISISQDQNQNTDIYYTKEGNYYFSKPFLETVLPKMLRVSMWKTISSVRAINGTEGAYKNSEYIYSKEFMFLTKDPYFYESNASLEFATLFMSFFEKQIADIFKDEKQSEIKVTIKGQEHIIAFVRQYDPIPGEGTLFISYSKQSDKSSKSSIMVSPKLFNLIYKTKGRSKRIFLNPFFMKGFIEAFEKKLPSEKKDVFLEYAKWKYRLEFLYRKDWHATKSHYYSSVETAYPKYFSEQSAVFLIGQKLGFFAPNAKVGACAKKEQFALLLGMLELFKKDYFEALKQGEKEIDFFGTKVDLSKTNPDLAFSYVLNLYSVQRNYKKEKYPHSGKPPASNTKVILNRSPLVFLITENLINKINPSSWGGYLKENESKVREVLNKKVEESPVRDMKTYKTSPLDSSYIIFISFPGGKKINKVLGAIKPTIKFLNNPEKPNATSQVFSEPPSKKKVGYIVDPTRFTTNDIAESDYAKIKNPIHSLSGFYKKEIFGENRFYLLNGQNNSLVPYRLDVRGKETENTNFSIALYEYLKPSLENKGKVNLKKLMFFCHVFSHVLFDLVESAIDEGNNYLDINHGKKKYSFPIWTLGTGKVKTKSGKFYPLYYYYNKTIEAHQVIVIDNLFFPKVKALNQKNRTGYDPVALILYFYKQHQDDFYKYLRYHGNISLGSDKHGPNSITRNINDYNRIKKSIKSDATTKKIIKSIISQIEKAQKFISIKPMSSYKRHFVGPNVRPAENQDFNKAVEAELKKIHEELKENHKEVQNRTFVPVLLNPNQVIEKRDTGEQITDNEAPQGEGDSNKKNVKDHLPPASQSSNDTFLKALASCTNYLDFINLLNKNSDNALNKKYKEIVLNRFKQIQFQEYLLLTQAHQSQSLYESSREGVTAEWQKYQRFVEQKRAALNELVRLSNLQAALPHMESYASEGQHINRFIELSSAYMIKAQALHKFMLALFINDFLMMMFDDRPFVFVLQNLQTYPVEILRYATFSYGAATGQGIIAPFSRMLQNKMQKSRDFINLMSQSLNKGTASLERSFIKKLTKNIRNFNTHWVLGQIPFIAGTLTNALLWSNKDDHHGPQDTLFNHMVKSVLSFAPPSFALRFGTHMTSTLVHNMATKQGAGKLLKNANYFVQGVNGNFLFQAIILAFEFYFSHHLLQSWEISAQFTKERSSFLDYAQESLNLVNLSGEDLKNYKETWKRKIGLSKEDSFYESYQESFSYLMSYYEMAHVIKRVVPSLHKILQGIKRLDMGYNSWDQGHYPFQTNKQWGGHIIPIVNYESYGYLAGSLERELVDKYQKEENIESEDILSQGKQPLAPERDWENIKKGLKDFKSQDLRRRYAEYEPKIFHESLAADKAMAQNYLEEISPEVKKVLKDIAQLIESYDEELVLSYIYPSKESFTSQEIELEAIQSKMSFFQKVLNAISPLSLEKSQIKELLQEQDIAEQHYLKRAWRNWGSFFDSFLDFSQEDLSRYHLNDYMSFVLYLVQEFSSSYQSVVSKNDLCDLIAEGENLEIQKKVRYLENMAFALLRKLSGDNTKIEIYQDGLKNPLTVHDLQKKAKNEITAPVESVILESTVYPPRLTPQNYFDTKGHYANQDKSSINGEVYYPFGGYSAILPGLDFLTRVLKFAQYGNDRNFMFTHVREQVSENQGVAFFSDNSRDFILGINRSFQQIAPKIITLIELSGHQFKYFCNRRGAPLLHGTKDVVSLENLYTYCDKEKGFESYRNQQRRERLVEYMFKLAAQCFVANIPAVHCTREVLADTPTNREQVNLLLQQVSMTDLLEKAKDIYLDSQRGSQGIKNNTVTVNSNEVSLNIKDCWEVMTGSSLTASAEQFKPSYQEEILNTCRSFLNYREEYQLIIHVVNQLGPEVGHSYRIYLQDIANPTNGERTQVLAVPRDPYIRFMIQIIDIFTDMFPQEEEGAKN